MDAFELGQVAAARASSGWRYHEFLRKPGISVGLYALDAGGEDPQQPHTEDEVYYVTRGRATIRVDGEDREVGPGSIVHVGAGVEHRFHTIQEDFEVLVVFAPAEGSQRVDA